MEGKDITQSILAQAQKRAEEIISVAQQNKDKTLARAKEIVEEKRAEVLSCAEKECAQIVDRKVMLAKLDASKYVLGQKQHIIEEVYKRATERLASLDDQKYADFIALLIEEYADDGDEVIIASSEKRLTEDWLLSISNKINKRLSFSQETHQGIGGVVLRGKNYDKKLTLSSLIDELRVKTESQVITKLFG